MEKIKKYKFNFMDLWLVFSTLIIVYCLIITITSSRSTDIYPDEFRGAIYTKSGGIYYTCEEDDRFTLVDGYYVLTNTYDDDLYTTKILVSEIEAVRIDEKVSDTSGGN